MQLNCRTHGPYEVPNTPAACPVCLAETGTTLQMCDNHGPQVLKPGNSCSFCVMEQLADQPMYRVIGRESAPITTYFKPAKSARKATRG
jgi:predicted amidophosphoribosyltransferase